MTAIVRISDNIRTVYSVRMARFDEAVIRYNSMNELDTWFSFFLS